MAAQNINAGVVKGADGANPSVVEKVNTTTTYILTVTYDTPNLKGQTGPGSTVPGPQGENPQYRMDPDNPNTLQYRFATQTPTTWTDLYTFAVFPANPAHTYEEETGGTTGIDAIHKTTFSDFQRVKIVPALIPVGKGNPTYYAYTDFYGSGPNN
jgi:hypothetical protein